jgi:alpha-N-arabinofuranosidase
MPVTPSGFIELRMTVDGGKTSFFHSEDKQAWIPLIENADARLLSTKSAGGFVGTLVGIHARQD